VAQCGDINPIGLADLQDGVALFAFTLFAVYR